MADNCDTTRRENKWLRRGLAINITVSALASLVTLVGFFGLRPKPVYEPDIRVFQAKPAENVKAAVVGADEKPFVKAFGWVPPTEDDEAEAVDPARTLHFGDTPAGKVMRGKGEEGAQAEDDVFLWRAVRMALNLGDDRYPNVNQQSVGCCVGCGWKHCADVTQAVQITTGLRQDELRPISVEAIYGASRVEVGKRAIRGDGSQGSWAAKAVRQYGLLAMQEYPGGIDLTTFSPARARQWGSSGIPDALEPTAAQNKVGTTALVRTWADLENAIRQGYPVAVCSDQGFEGMNRDKDGFVRPSGTWPHCMAFLGIRGGSRPGAFLLNSWGDSAHGGPRYPADMPVAGFWADKAVVERMLRQNDSYAVSDLTGFPARKLNWFIRIERFDLVLSVPFGGFVLLPAVRHVAGGAE